jgi:hypothetical protein
VVRLPIIFLALAVAGCAGPNPNPGERTADIAWSKYEYPRALEILEPAAERGEPWAQLRLGVGYELGAGYPKDISKAIYWYKKAAVQLAEGNWANGLLVGAAGKVGYFNQNGDALIAQHQLAGIYFRGDSVERDLVKAYLLEKNVSKTTNGKSLFYCCEFSGGRYITAEAISNQLQSIEGAMSALEKKEAVARLESWDIRNGL